MAPAQKSLTEQYWVLSRNRRKFRRKTPLAWFPVTEPFRHCLPCRSCRSSGVVFRQLSCVSENTCFTTEPISFGNSSHASCWFKWRQVTRLLVLPQMLRLLAAATSQPLTARELLARHLAEGGSPVHPNTLSVALRGHGIVWATRVRQLRS